MTRRSSNLAPSFTLATDLDGTFLGGSASGRRALYAWIEEHRAAVDLIFVTGRDLPFVESSCVDGIMPWPDYVIGDVGTTIAVRDPKTNRLHPDPELETPIAALWGDGIDPIREALDAAPGLVPQDGPFRYRMSYHYDPSHYDPAIRQTIEAAGFDCLVSDNRFLDVLPKGVSKGPSLMRLLAHLDMPVDRVLVAGDTLNDLSLFETGLSGVVVGNGEPALITQVISRNNVYVSDRHGAAGVLDAIRSLGFVDTVLQAVESEKEFQS